MGISEVVECEGVMCVCARGKSLREKYTEVHSRGF